MIKRIFKRLYRIIHPLETQQELQKRLKAKGMVIGDRCRIFSDIDGPEVYLIKLGDNVTIASGARFITHDNSISKVLPEYSNIFGRIIIGNNCFIGAYSTILCGVTVGDNAIVGAGSLVVKSIPPGEIWGGVPAKKIGDVEGFSKRNHKYGISTRGLSYEEKKNLLLKSTKLVRK